jgi:hypothetical protein
MRPELLACHKFANFAPATFTSTSFWPAPSSNPQCYVAPRLRPLALVQTGDEITRDAPGRTLTLEVSRRSCCAAPTQRRHSRLCQSRAWLGSGSIWTTYNRRQRADLDFLIGTPEIGLAVVSLRAGPYPCHPRASGTGNASPRRA